jgi:5-methylthioadenosine/S-adenosylhomocysteine deaminase
MKKVDIIIRGDYVLTMEGDLPVITDGAVAVAGTKIIDTGTFNSISKIYSSKKVLDGKDKVILPGLINTHTHAAMVYFRGIADDLPLQEWLEKHIWPNEMKWLTAEFVNDAVEDMYFFEDTAAKKLEQIGMRGVLGSGIIDFPWKGIAESPDDYFKNAETLIKNWKKSELIVPCIAPHATYTCGPDNYRRARTMAEQYDVPLHTHLAETQFEVAECQKRYGKTPVEHLDDIGFLSERVSAAHCVWLTDKEIEILAKRNVGVSHCIESNLKLASGFAPVSKMLKAGIKVAFGTDGAASNNDLSILGELSTAAKVHKTVSNDPTALDSKTALLMATRYGAEILGLGEKTGSLRKGKSADIIIANLSQPHLGMRPSDIETVMVNGKIVVDNGMLTTGDEPEILSKARAWQKKIKEQ